MPGINWNTGRFPVNSGGRVRTDEIGEPGLNFDVDEDDDVIHYQLVTMVVRCNPVEWTMDNDSGSLTEYIFGGNQYGDVTVMGVTPVRDEWGEVMTDWADHYEQLFTNRVQTRSERVREALRDVPDPMPSSNQLFPHRVVPPDPTMVGFGSAVQMRAHFGIRTPLIGADEIVLTTPETPNRYSSMDAADSYCQASHAEGLRQMIRAYCSHCNSGEYDWGEWRHVTIGGRTVAFATPTSHYPVVGPMTAMSIDTTGNVWLRFFNAQPGGAAQGMVWKVDQRDWDWWSLATPGAPTPGAPNGSNIPAVTMMSGCTIGSLDTETRYNRWIASVRQERQRWPSVFGQPEQPWGNNTNTTSFRITLDNAEARPLAPLADLLPDEEIVTHTPPARGTSIFWSRREGADQ